LKHDDIVYQSPAGAAVGISRHHGPPPRAVSIGSFCNGGASWELPS
jgi:hypothetical protein